MKTTRLGAGLQGMLLACMLFASVTTPPAAQAAWPERPVTQVVTCAPGGSADDSS